VLCPGWNDGKELERSLSDLIKHDNIGSIACVPVGLTGHREGLCKLEPFNKQTASEVVDITEQFGDKTVKMYGERRVFAADEFYLTAEKEMPDALFYGDFLQLENGVGMWAMLKSECEEAIDDYDSPEAERHVTVVTGEAAYPLLLNIVDNVAKKWHNFKCGVVPIKNNFFGGKITVTGLITGTDILEQLKGKDLGSELLISSSMLRHEGDMFLDSVTVEELQERLNVKITVVESDGWSLLDALHG
jgi:NifB/MoaA-like Fe-S oxidoreductase